ncbi:MAG TPA: cupredoxin domain-containing protein [Pyrinomonadaceae bacterium]|nr:cupredoxin domain-containing protein [Pyrinomonadaceae bacterium]
MRKLSIFIIALAIFVLNACHSENDGHNHSPKTNTNTAKTENPSTYKGFRAELKSEPAEIVPNQPVKLTVTIKDEAGAIVKDLQIVHEKPLHFLIVSDDLAEFYHIHPEPQADGTLVADFTFPKGGKYFAFADYTPKGATQIVDRLPIEIDGAQRTPEPLKADAKLEKTQENLRVVMKPDAEIESNKEMMLNFMVMDAATNKPVTDLENYLGEKAHFVIISEDLKDFVHAHPMSGDNIKSSEHKHDEKISANAEMPTVSAHVTFPNAGLYKVFVEIKRAGKVMAIPFVVNVKQGKTDKILTDAKIPAGYYKITVSKDGFAPSEVNLSGDNGVKLAFLRVDKENCGDEIVFKDLNIRKKLPVGEVVTVEIPKDTKGEINFSCGMDMMKGKIVVQ